MSFAIQTTIGHLPRANLRHLWLLFVHPTPITNPENLRLTLQTGRIRSSWFRLRLSQAASLGLLSANGSTSVWEEVCGDT